MSTLIDSAVAEAKVPDRAHALEMLERMMLTRAYELKLRELGLLMTCTSVGHEASAVGVVSALTSDDLILTNHRSAGHLIARGADPGRMLAEVMGKSTGYCKGKSGTLHISIRELGVMLTSTIVGGELSLAPGVALSQSMLSKPGIVVVFFGDGAATEGIFHESVNLASVWDLPVLYVCENNQWQAWVRREETMQTDHISKWAKSYGIEGLTVDGNNVQAVHEAALVAAQSVRSTQKPFLLETYTYRMHGHMGIDDQKHIDPRELVQWGAKDPIEQMKQALAITADEFVEIENRVKQSMDAAAQFAADSPYPDLSELTTDVYA